MKIIMYLSLAIIIIFVYLRTNNKQTAVSKIRLPNILNGASCFMNEVNIKTLLPVPLHGRVDQVFILKDGRLIILDTKVRDRIKVYPSDIVQLSVYAVILKYNGYNVCPTALLRFPQNDGRTIYQTIHLYKEEKVISLYHRYISIMTDKKLVVCRCGKHQK